MENRFLLAIILSLAMFVIWGWFLSLTEPPPQQQAEVVEKEKPQKTPVPEEVPELVAPTPLETSTPSEEAELISPEVETPAEETAETEKERAPPKPQIPEKNIEIVNGNLTYIINSRGAVLKSVLTHKVKDNEGKPIDLIKKQEGSLLPLSLKADHAAMNNAINRGVYEASADHLELSESNKKASLTLTLDHPSGLKVERTYHFEYGNFLITTDINISAQPFATENVQYSILWGPGLGGAQESQADYIVFSGPTTFINNERVETILDDMEKDIEVHKGDLVWTGFQNKYFAAALIPKEGIKYGVVEKVDEDAFVGLKLESVQSNSTASFMVYAGTKELQVLENSGHKLVRLIDYGWFGNKFAFMVKPILKALNFFYEMTGNYGWSIIFLTVIIKLIFFPLTHKSFKSMKGMQKVQPHVKKIQEVHKDDRERMNQEMMALYKKHKVNPLGGCLPMLLQIPVFIALYHALFFSIELRGAPFMLWITDLSKSDPYFVTPVIMGATMFLQQKLTPSVADPVQQKIFLMMPIVFTFLFITFPSGLVIYWTVNNILTISQQYYIYHIAKD